MSHLEKKEVKELKKIARKALTLKEIFKILRIKNKKEREEMLRYIILTKIELKYHDVLLKFERNKENIRDYKEVQHNLSNLKHKIDYFKIEPKEEDFYKILFLIKKIEMEIKDGVV
ncbi:MAG: hypothetical protein QW273_02265 [Candidatus Pacearchaeota archaeon]